MKKAFIMFMVIGLVSIAKAQVTNLYHFEREFVPVTNSAAPVTAYKIIMGADQLTGIVGPTNIIIISNQTFATEYEGFAWGYGSHYAAWTSALSVHPQYYQIHSNVFYDNVGYIKGTREAYGTYGAYVWYLKNTIAFTSSASSVYVDASGVTSPIASVLVGTIGDFCPQTVVTDVGPLLNTNYLGDSVSTDYVARADVNAYYKLVPVAYLGVNNDDSDGDGIPDFADGYNRDSSNSLDNVSSNDFFTPWKLMLSGYANPTQAQIRITYSASAPMSVSVTTNGYFPASGYFRLWRKQGFQSRTGTSFLAGGDYIPSGTYAATSLGFSASTRLVDVFIEPVNPGTNQTLLVEVDPDGNGPKGFVCVDRLSIGVLSITLEPITIRPGNGATFPLYNPCGIKLGTSAVFEVSVYPTNYPNENIMWRATTGSISFVGSNTGRIITIQANSISTNQLAVDIQNYYGVSPTIDVQVRTSATVNVTVFIVTDGLTPATPEARVTNLLADANQVYEQVGIHFQIQGGINYITNSAWLDIDTSVGEYMLLTSTTSVTSGVEMYFVDTFDSSTNMTGANVNPGNGVYEGLILTDVANFRTAAHELGHAGMLMDIYVSDSGTQLPSNLVNQAWAPLDWNSGSAPLYYQSTLTHAEILLRVLMNGRPSQIKADIPAGRLYGVRYGGALDWVEVGLQDLQTPHHY